LGSGCHTAFATHVTGDTLYLFHEDAGQHSFPMNKNDYEAPADTAERVLRKLGLL
jgi:hydroxymethylbilane synthase